MLRRIIRIVPFYWSGSLFLFSIACFFPHVLRQTKADVPHLLYSLFFIPHETTYCGMFPTLILGWTLNCEMYFYALFAFALVLSRRLAPIICSVFLTLIVLAIDFSGAQNESLRFYAQPIVFEFVFGIFVYHAVTFIDRRADDYRGVRWLKWLLYGSTLTASAFIVVQGIKGGFGLPRAIVSGLPALIIVLGTILIEKLYRVRAKNKLIFLLGEASYILYLIHPYVIYGVLRMLIGPTSGLGPVTIGVLVLALLVLPSAVALVIHVWFEKPIMSYLRELYFGLQNHLCFRTRCRSFSNRQTHLRILVELPILDFQRHWRNLIYQHEYIRIVYRHRVLDLYGTDCVRIRSLPDSRLVAVAANRADGSVGIGPGKRWPRLTLLIAAYNEEAVIERRVLNALDMDYPRDRLEIVIGLDGCSDRTAEIVSGFGHRGVRLLDFDERRGKASVLNAAMSRVDGDIVLMSDANTDIDPQAARQLVRWFRDPRVGAAVGRLILTDAGSGRNVDGLYWQYETFLKRCEGRLGALLGANGAIYAIRRDLFQPIPNQTLIDDFVIPLLAKLNSGCLIIYEPTAVAREETPADVRSEFRRRTRIGAGGFQSIGMLWRLLDPRRGWVALAFLSHKVLRWICPFLMIGLFVSNLWLLEFPFYRLVLVSQLGLYLVSGLAAFLPPLVKFLKPLRLATMFTSMNLALFVGFWRWLIGRQTGTWARTSRVPSQGAMATDPSL